MKAGAFEEIPNGGRTEPDHPSSDNTREDDGGGQPNPQHEAGIQKELEQVQPKLWNLIVPLGVLLAATAVLLWSSGAEGGKRGRLQAFLHADATESMLVAIALTLTISLGWYALRRESLTELMFHFVYGGNKLMPVIILLVLVWAVSASTQELGFNRFVLNAVEGRIPTLWIASIIFLGGSLVSYFIGSSAGTWGLLMPLAIPLAATADASIPLVAGAVFASGTFGSVASPLGDSTATIATVLGLSPVRYAQMKLPSTLVAAGISALLYAVAGFVL